MMLADGGALSSCLGMASRATVGNQLETLFPLVNTRRALLVAGLVWEAFRIPPSERFWRSRPIGQIIPPLGMPTAYLYGCIETQTPVRRIGDYVFIRLRRASRQIQTRLRGTVFVEYLLLLTLVGIGVIVGLTTLRGALVNELGDLANAINAINS
jgi:pilus assembly protein Flp/PilA